MKKIIQPTCEHCIFASESWSDETTGDWLFCIKIFEKVDVQLDYADDPAKVRLDFGCIFFKDKDEENNLPDN